MGGCKCSYKNCHVKSDGKTHMFHYPVFDKLRCHQWLLNAMKLDFLNLKVSQLKNRVICQHHFKDDNFMNYKKDKLTFDAIPTLDGPYCDSVHYTKTNEENIESFPLILEDIENDNISYCDKRANYSIKYGDFLTNSEISFVTSLDTKPANIDITLDYNQENTNEEILKKDIKKKGKNSDSSQIERYSDKLAFQPNTNNTLLKPTESMVNISNNISNTIKFSEETKQCEPSPIVKLDKIFLNTKVSERKTLNDDQTNLIVNNTPKRPEPKVKILSQKKIKKPFSIPRNLEPVSPSLLIKMPQRKENQQDPNSIDLSGETPRNNSEIVKTLMIPQVLEIQYEPIVEENPPKIIKEITSPKKQANKCLLRTDKPKVSLLKNKINPQRIAAIEKKRKFNMKLRDIIETCLNKKSPTKNETQQRLQSEIEANEIKKNKKHADNSTQVGTFLSKKPELPSAQEYTIAYLDARMKRLENTLLNRIDQNTQKIMELKNSIAQAPAKKNTTVQTHEDEESYKKHLYQEISQFLSPTSNSVLYEELFINKFSLEKEGAAAIKPKRRKYR